MILRILQHVRALLNTDKVKYDCAGKNLYQNIRLVVYIIDQIC